MVTHERKGTMHLINNEKRWKNVIEANFEEFAGVNVKLNQDKSNWFTEYKVNEKMNIIKTKRIVEYRVWTKRKKKIQQ